MTVMASALVAFGITEWMYIATEMQIFRFDGVNRFLCEQMFL